MNQEEIKKYGDELFQALVAKKPVDPLTDRVPGITLEDAYQIQSRMIQLRLDRGETIVGKKIGLTSKAVQTMLGVDQPDFGQLTSTMVYGDGEAIPSGELIRPRAEGEIAFVLKSDLKGPGLSNVDVIRATDFVIPCIEIVDSRIKDWKIKIQDTVADNASSGVFVVGSGSATLDQIDINTVGMVLEKNGEIANTGAGAAALGSPINAVCWLANTLGSLGISLKAGEVILSGALGPLVDVNGGDSIRMTLGGIGSVSARFID